MTVTMKLKRYSPNDLQGFVNVVCNNGYAIRFRKGSCVHLMADITDDEAIGREWEAENEADGG